MRATNHGLIPLSVILLLVGSGLAIAEEEPDYPHGDFEEDCSLCHGPEGWRPARISDEFDHRKLAGFALSGAHRTADCRGCHVTLEFRALDRECVSCHQDVHLGELSPDCERCHTTRNFIERNDQVRSHVTTRFPLRGAHVAADCDQCHPLQPPGALRYVNTPTDCYACHRVDYDATTDPNHPSSGFSTDCEQCHTVTAWELARFDHSAVGFQLTGQHRNLRCEDCHIGNDFTNTPADCVGCHLDDYQGTTNPDHTAAGYSTECQLCHSTTAWRPAQLNHNFPLTGNHNRDCQECHTTGNLNEFSCLGLCHEHPQSEMDPKHSGKPGYSYDFPLCVSCHPDGTAPED